MNLSKALQQSHSHLNLTIQWTPVSFSSNCFTRTSIMLESKSDVQFASFFDCIFFVCFTRFFFCSIHWEFKYNKCYTVGPLLYAYAYAFGKLFDLIWRTQLEVDLRKLLQNKNWLKKSIKCPERFLSPVRWNV